MDSKAAKMEPTEPKWSQSAPTGDQTKTNKLSSEKVGFRTPPIWRRGNDKPVFESIKVPKGPIRGAKAMPTLIKINAKTGVKKDNENHQKSFLLCVKTCKSMFKTMRFEGLAGRVRERKRYQQIIKHDTQKWSEKQYTNHSESSKIGPWSAQWSKRCSRLIKDACDLPPKVLC